MNTIQRLGLCDGHCQARAGEMWSRACVLRPSSTSTQAARARAIAARPVRWALEALTCCRTLFPCAGLRPWALAPGDSGTGALDGMARGSGAPMEPTHCSTHIGWRGSISAVYFSKRLRRLWTLLNLLVLGSREAISNRAPTAERVKQL